MNAELIANWTDRVWGRDCHDSPWSCSQTWKERFHIAETALQCVPEGGNILEIGVLGGLSLSVLLLVAAEKKAKVYACDPFVDNGEAAERHFGETMMLFPRANLDFRKVKSEEMRSAIGDIPLNFIHIDGDHFDVAKDCALWLPLLVSGGCVAFHDVIPDPRSPIYQVYLDVINCVPEDWPVIHWAKDENRQMIRRKP